MKFRRGRGGGGGVKQYMSREQPLESIISLHLKIPAFPDCLFHSTRVILEVTSNIKLE